MKLLKLPDRDNCTQENKSVGCCALTTSKIQIQIRIEYKYFQKFQVSVLSWDNTLQNTPFLQAKISVFILFSISQVEKGFKVGYFVW